MNKVEEYVEASGTKSSVVEMIMLACSLEKEVSKKCLKFIKENTEILSDEEFFQYSKLEEYEIEGISEFISEEGEYYISIKKTTLFLVILFLKYKFPYLKIAADISVFFELFNFKGGYVKLDEKEGYLCILMELARRRKHGAKKDMLTKFKGECCNNHLQCLKNENGKCNCNESFVEKACEYFLSCGIVAKKGKRYFYIV